MSIKICFNGVRKSITPYAHSVHTNVVSGAFRRVSTTHSVPITGHSVTNNTANNALRDMPERLNKLENIVKELKSRIELLTSARPIAGKSITNDKTFLVAILGLGLTVIGSTYAFSKDVKQDLKTEMDKLEKRLEAKIEGTEKRLEAKIEGTEKRLEAKIEEFKTDLRKDI